MNNQLTKIKFQKQIQAKILSRQIKKILSNIFKEVKNLNKKIRIF